EANFHPSASIDKQNCRLWGLENLRAVYRGQLRLNKRTVWCSATSEAIIGLYFFEDTNGNAATITARQYQAMIKDFLRSMVEDKTQDEPTADAARATMALLRQILGERIMSRGCEVNWQLRSRLMAPEFFLWGYPKERLCVSKLRTLQELKINIQVEIRALQPETLTAVMEHAIERARLCESENGRHARDVIFRNQRHIIPILHTLLRVERKLEYLINKKVITILSQFVTYEPPCVCFSNIFLGK
ncbi:hypothetical protein WH47_01977, partial [Habropoda laboriosa]